VEADLSWEKIVEIEGKLIEELEYRHPVGERILGYIDALSATRDPRAIGAFLVLVWPCFEARIETLFPRLHKWVFYPVEFATTGTLQDAVLDLLSDFVMSYPVEKLHEIDRSVRRMGPNRWGVVAGRTGCKWWVAPPDLNGSPPGTRHAVELCLLSCHANGYVRERAVALLAGAHTAIAIRFLVLRSMDWVEQVAVRATQASGAILTETPELVFDVLPLVPRLSRSARPQAQRLCARVAEVLAATAQRDLLLNAVRSNDRHISRAASKIADRLDDIALQPVAEAAATSRDAVTRSCAIKWEARLRVSAPGFVQELRARFLADPASGLRADALRAHIAVGGNAAVVRAALSDSSATVRETARYHLRETTRRRFADFYRSSIASAGSVDELAAGISGLGKVGDQTDAGLLRTFLTASPRAARAAMRALAKLDPSGSRDLFVEMLGDRRPGIQRQALRLITGRLTETDVSTLRRHAAKGTTENRRSVALAMLRLPVWDSLACLLDLAFVDLEAAVEAIGRCKAESRRGYAPPRLDASAGEQLKAAFSAVVKALSPRVAEYIGRELSYWTKG
jgi:hypothetical protein